MTKKKSDIKTEFDKTKKEVIDLKEFILLDAKKQYAKIEEILNLMYEETIKITTNQIDKVLNISFDVSDNEIYLPHSLKVEKIGSKLFFSFKDKNNWPLIILFLLGFLFVGGAATYSGFYYMSMRNFNIDLNGDGIPDLNLDLDDDRVCDVNCDTNKDKMPDTNIDYRGNQKPTFNVLRDDKTIFNKVNQDTNDDGICDINCDTNKDGWPDTNIDLDGDGTPDVNIDVDNDGIPDLNIDVNGDGKPNANIDNDGDGKCDINCIASTTYNKEKNIDLDGDGICDINCDTNDDNIPDENIDYNGSKKPTFNVKEDKKFKNPMNQDTNNDGKCDINCDINGDGWPDTNIDLDGDGTPDINIDINNDGVPDLNIDNDGDGLPDLNIDDDNDGMCDINCSSVITKKDPSGVDVSGNNSVGAQTAALTVVFNGEGNIIADNIFPDDQEGTGVTTTIPDLTFRITNNSTQTLYYDLRWLITTNTFESDNFWYRVTSTNGGYNATWQTAPKENSTFQRGIAIRPNTTQYYTVSTTLHGTGEEQNYDQGRKFDARIEVVLP